MAVLKFGAIYGFKAKAERRLAVKAKLQSLLYLYRLVTTSG
jgi:hypothetical protein